MLLDMVFLFDLSASLRMDPGTAFTAEAIKYLCRRSSVSVNNGPAGHAHTQATTKKMRRWLHEALVELGKTWTRE